MVLAQYAIESVARRFEAPQIPLVAEGGPPVCAARGPRAGRRAPRKSAIGGNPVGEDRAECYREPPPAGFFAWPDAQFQPRRSVLRHDTSRARFEFVIQLGPRY